MRLLSFNLNHITFFDILFILVWISNPLFVYARIVLTHIPIIYEFADIIIPAVNISVIIASRKFLKRTIKVVDVLLYIGILCVYLFHYVLYHSNMEFMEEHIFSFFFSVLPMYFIGISLIHIKKILPHLEFFSYIAIVCYFVFKNIVSEGGELISPGGDMNGAYALLPFLTFITWRFFERGGFLCILPPIISIIIFFLLGNRGAMLCYSIFVVLYLTLIFKLFRKPITLIVLILFIVAILFVFDDFLVHIFDFSKELGYSTRILEKIVNGEMLDSSGRDSISDYLMMALSSKPILGYGLTGDRYLLDGVYAHNIIFEVLVSFGLLFGSLILILLTYLFIKAFLSAKEKELRSIFLILVTCGLFPLFLSSTFLNWPNFFTLLGFSVYLVYRQNNMSGIGKSDFVSSY